QRHERTRGYAGWTARYTMGDNKLGDCLDSHAGLARGVLYLIAGGGDLQEARNTGRSSPRSRSELAGSSECGRGYEPRLKRQRTVLYDRLAWTNPEPPDFKISDSSVGWRDGSRQDRHSNPVSGSDAQRSIPGGS